MQSVILCIFEGEKREHQYFERLQRQFLGENNVVKCSFGNDIYELFKVLSEDEYALDTIEIVRELKNVPKNKELLSNLTVDDVNQIYLFFDMDCHDEQYCHQKLQDMVRYFSDETEMGKLFISYPMVEAIRDVETFENFENVRVTREDCTRYKNVSARGMEVLKDYRKITKDLWLKLVKLNVSRANLIVGNEGQLDADRLILPEQENIALKQCEALDEEGVVFVLSAFPVFLFHQYGENLFTNK